jgi:spermidine synthase
MVDLDIEYDELISRLNVIPYQPEFISDYYLFDRLNQLKIERLATLFNSAAGKSINRPIILHYQLLMSATLNKIDSFIFRTIFYPNFSPIIIGLIIILLFFLTHMSGNRRRKYSLFLYWTAGFVSITLELVSFYIYQTQAGMLYGDLALLISMFMLGLAFGTYYSGRLNKENLEFPSLLLLLSSVFIFYVTYDSISMNLMLIYHSLFLFVVAMATGSLFVAATDRYYFGRVQANRGLGYAFEIGGSALGALTATTLLLPIIGLSCLLVSIIVLILIALVGAFLTVNK